MKQKMTKSVLSLVLDHEVSWVKSWTPMGRSMVAVATLLLVKQYKVKTMLKVQDWIRSLFSRVRSGLCPGPDL